MPLITRKRTIRVYNRKKLHYYNPKYFIALYKVIMKKASVQMITWDNDHNRLYYVKEGQHR